MFKAQKIAVIGTGNIGEALVGGMLAAGLCLPDNIVCTDVCGRQREHIASTYRVAVTADNTAAVQQSNIVIYAVKPQILADVLQETAGVLDLSRLIISVAAGVPLAAIAGCLKKDLRLIRVMPNIAVFAGAGATAITCSGRASPADVSAAETIFASIGRTVQVADESLMDAVTGLSGSGPAFFFLIAEALADGGVNMGLSRKDALLLASQTMLGSARMLLQEKEHPAQLKDRVASPGGTTIAGLQALERGALRATLIDAVEAAAQRARELGADWVEMFTAKSG